MRVSITAAATALLATTASAQIVGKCTGQSCAIANLSGSTGIPYDVTLKTKGGSDAGTQCIKDHAKLGAGVTTDGSTIAPPKAQSAKFRRTAQAASCKPYTLLFAKGTMEPGPLGVTIGPMLSRQLGSTDWTVQGVDYTPDMLGNWCVGLPGGVKCVEQLATLAKDCPNTKLVVGGYSQGAMVAHNCVAFSTPQIKEKVLGVLNFGDPFNGAGIKGYPTAKIKTFCNDTDGVCQGEFKITAGHLAYMSDGSVGKAISWLKQTVGAA